MTKIAKTTGSFRWKPILISTGLLFVLGLGWFFLHQVQLGSIYGRFLEQAARAEESGNPERAARFLRHYLLVNRDDLDARARYGLLCEQTAADRRAFEQ